MRGKFKPLTTLPESYEILPVKTFSCCGDFFVTLKWK